MISKIKFVEVIESMRIQHKEDLKNGSLIEEAFGVNDVLLYDNSRLVISIFQLLHEFFPKDPDGNCEIANYCFDLNFGKPTPDSEWETPGELYDRLTKK